MDAASLDRSDQHALQLGAGCLQVILLGQELADVRRLGPALLAQVGDDLTKAGQVEWSATSSRLWINGLGLPILVGLRHGGCLCCSAHPSLVITGSFSLDKCRPTVPRCYLSPSDGRFPGR